MPDNKDKLLSKEDFALWKRHPITRAIFKDLRESKADLERALSSGGTLTGEAGATAEKTARMIGNIEGIRLLLNIKYEDEEGASYGMPD